MIIAIFTACELKRDMNDDLGGMWQLTLWTDAQGDTVATNENAIYYHFQMKLMKLDRWDGRGLTNEVLARFKHEGQKLTITQAYLRPDDSTIDLSTLKDYGIPQDGCFNIDALTDDRMQLSSPEGTLCFRKY